METKINSSEKLKELMLRSPEEGYVISPDALFEINLFERESNGCMHFVYEHVNPSDKEDIYLVTWGEFYRGDTPYSQGSRGSGEVDIS